ncbi:YwaF family protein [Dorea acetigenes]|uniref:YwaF family protein n=1 Tax=Dorea acetigenes TaxID=2981787 RepID=A0ABT2RHU6_9FIRM|nr:YwaF family protein [Dorea acetigenes]MCU6684963.1 YwaF family protein [Dorea acetigenes]
MRRQNRIFFIFGIILLLSEIWKQYCLTYIVNPGSYDWWYFPFQLCSIPMYVCLLLPFAVPESIHRAMEAFLMDFGLLGGIFAFFDTSGMKYSFFPLTCHSYLWHIFLIIIGITAGVSCRPQSWNDFKNSVYIYLSCCGIASIFNVCFGSLGSINMFYINPAHRMSQKVFRNIADALGNNAGILIYIAATILGAGIFHFIWRQILKKSCH